MPPRKKYVQSSEVRVYKDDGVWWAEIDDPEHGTRATYGSGPEGFLDRVDQMVWYVDLELEDIDWAPQDAPAKKFLNRARKLHGNTAESKEELDTDEDEDDDSAGE